MPMVNARQAKSSYRGGAMTRVGGVGWIRGRRTMRRGLRVLGLLRGPVLLRDGETFRQRLPAMYRRTSNPAPPCQSSSLSLAACASSKTAAASAWRLMMRAHAMRSASVQVNCEPTRSAVSGSPKTWARPSRAFSRMRPSSRPARIMRISVVIAVLPFRTCSLRLRLDLDLPAPNHSRPHARHRGSGRRRRGTRPNPPYTTAYPQRGRKSHTTHVRGQSALGRVNGKRKLTRLRCISRWVVKPEAHLQTAAHARHGGYD